VDEWTNKGVIVNIASDAPRRPALRYYGGKWKLAPWIISHFPKHLNYVEPCGGAASVLLQKPRSPLETYNDLDGNVVNFFRVLRDQPEELIRKIRLTPWARAEFEECRCPMGDDVERARQFFASAWQGISSMPHDKHTGWRTVSYSGQSYSPQVHNYFDMVDSETLGHLARRFYGVQIDNRESSYIIDRYDDKDTLFYFDPPYVEETRASNNVYAIDWNGNQLHIEAAELLRQCAGYVVVSGYACPLYTELYESHGWHRVDKEAQTNSGGKRIESLWLSPRTWKALQNDYSDMPMFA
jgi:DNA adenine methylase